MSLKSKFRRILLWSRFLGLLVTINFFYTNCTQGGNIALSKDTLNSQNLINSPTEQLPPTTPRQPDSDNVVAEPEPEITAPEQTKKVLEAFQPALAVRGMACLMCHADIRSNVITDFGYGNPWYLGGGQNIDGANTNQGAQSWYANLAHSWQSMKQLQGTVIVPDKTIPTSIQKDLGKGAETPLSIADMILTPYKAFWNLDGIPEEENAPMSLKITPNELQPAVKSVSEILISSPTEAEMQQLATKLFSIDNLNKGSNAKFVVQVSQDNSSQSSDSDKNLIETYSADLVSSFTFFGTDNEHGYVKNLPNQVIDCQNRDLVFNTTVYLKNLKVKANGGCRIYSTKTIFIEGAITYMDDPAELATGTSFNPNIQMSSANAIIMGISLSKLQARYSDRRQAYISGARSFDDRFTQILAEATLIGTLADAQDSFQRTSIDYSQILLNAPIVESRYLGKVKGSIVADVALFALGAFYFEYDPVFSEVAVFPILSRAILGIKNNAN